MIDKAYIEQVLIYLSRNTDQRLIDEDLVNLWRSTVVVDDIDRLGEVVSNYTKYSDSFPSPRLILTLYKLYTPRLDRPTTKETALWWCDELREILITNKLAINPLDDITSL